VGVGVGERENNVCGYSNDEMFVSYSYVNNAKTNDYEYM
jgi:hypothetical protein